MVRFEVKKNKNIFIFNLVEGIAMLLCITVYEFQFLTAKLIPRRRIVI